jgi:hypothetical protein
MATAAMALSTRSLAKKAEESLSVTRDATTATQVAAEATQMAAQATRDDADATLLLVEQGRWAYQPVLAATFPNGAANTSGALHVNVQNIGPGLALGVVCAIRFDGAAGGWRCTQEMHLPAASLEAVVMAVRSEPVPEAWFTRSNGEMPPVVLFCRDMFDRRYRFVQDKDGHVRGPDVIEPHEVGNEGPYKWWTDRTLWPPTTAH